MISTRLAEVLTQNKTIKRVLETVFREKKGGKPGVTISKLSEKTGIERHRLSGILEVLVVLGILAVFEMGMTKLVTPTQTLMKMKHLIINLR